MFIHHFHSGWILDDEIAGQHWYRRWDGSHQYVIGNTHYAFLNAHGLNGRPTGGHIIADMAANAKYFKEVRSTGLSSGLYGGRCNNVMFTAYRLKAAA